MQFLFCFSFYLYECPGLCQTRAFINEKLADFEAFHWTNLLRTDFLLMKSDLHRWNMCYEVTIIFILYIIHYKLQQYKFIYLSAVCLWQHQASFFKIAEQWSKIAHKRAAMTDVIIIGCKSQKLNR